MPGWYIALSAISDDSGAPEDVRLVAAAAITYVDDLRRDYKRLRAIKQRALDALMGPDLQAAVVAARILGKD